MDTFIITHLDMQQKRIHYKTRHPVGMHTTAVWGHNSDFKYTKGIIQLTGLRKMESEKRKIARRVNKALRNIKQSFCSVVENEYEL